MQKKKILIIEKETLPDDSIRQKLEIKGFEVIDNIKSGTEALSSIKKDVPDLLLIDVHLKGPVDGIEVAKTIKKTFDIPVIFLLEKNDKSVLDTVKKNGPNTYIIRPVIANELYRTIELSIYKHEMEGKLKEKDEELSKVNAQLTNTIKELESANLELRKSEARFAEAQRIATVGSWEWNISNNRVHWTDELYRIFEVDKSMVRAGYELFIELLHPEDRDRVKDIVESVITEGHSKEFRHRIVAKDCVIKYLSSRIELLRDPDEKPVILMGVSQDITDQVVFEEALKRSETQYKITVDSLEEALHVVDKNYRIIVLNKRFSDWLEELEVGSDIIGENIFDSFPFLGDEIRGQYKNVFESGMVLVTEERNTVNKKEIYTTTKKMPVYENGEVAYVITVIYDMTKRKKVEEAFLISTSRLQAILENANVGIVLLDNRGTYEIVNNRFAEMFGYSPEEIIGLHVTELTHPEDKGITEKNIKDISSDSKKKIIQEKRYIRKDGTTFWAQVAISSIAGIDGETANIVSVVIDITDKKEALEAIKESEEKYRLIAENSNDVIFTVDIDGNMLYVSPSVERMRGFTPGEIIERGMRNGLVPESYEVVMCFMQADREQVNKGATSLPLSQVNVELYCKDGSTVWADIVVNKIFKKGKFQFFLCVARDITDKRTSEKELRLIQYAVDNNQNAIFRIKPDSYFSYVNKAASDMLGYQHDELRMLTISDIDPLWNYAIWEKEFARLKAVKITTFDSWYRKKDGTLFPVEIMANYFNFEDEEYIFTFASDITLRKQAEDQIRYSLVEKETLLREIHHRVKNNMQIVSSLLDLQMFNVVDERDRDLFVDSQNRIRAMALVHDKMYKTENLSNINFNDYVTSLTNEYINSYEDHSKTIKIITKVENVYIDIDKAIPCSLIINELITNAYKHAFKDMKSGEILVEFHKDDDQYYVLHITDSGVGLPPGFSLGKSESLGLQLVKSLTHQLKGTITHDHGGKGCAFTIRFK